MELRHSNDIGYVRIELSRKRWSEDESGEVSRVLFFDSFMGRILTAFHRLWNFMRRPLDRRCQFDRRWQRFGAVEVGLTSGKRVARCLRRARSGVNNWFILDNPFRHCATSKNIRAIAFFPVVSASSGMGQQKRGRRMLNHLFQLLKSWYWPHRRLTSAWYDEPCPMDFWRSFCFLPWKMPEN